MKNKLGAGEKIGRGGREGEAKRAFLCAANLSSTVWEISKGEDPFLGGERDPTNFLRGDPNLEGSKEYRVRGGPGEGLTKGNGMGGTEEELLCVS